MTETDKRFNIVDEKTPFNVPLTAHYRRSFAYHTIRDRLPVILTKVIDQISREKEIMISEYGEASREELKEVLGNLSQLKYELQTDKVFHYFDENSPDYKLWNTHLDEIGESNTYYSSVWLYAECYLYRRIKAIFEKQPSLKNHDYFAPQKELSLNALMDAMKTVAKTANEINLNNTIDKEITFKKYLKLNLWGNRCDLSISAGKQECNQASDPLNAIESLEQFILADNTSEIWDCLSHGNPEENIIDIVNDNAGYELFTDLVLADFLIKHNLARKIRFHVKSFPWFISDVMPHDFDWTLKTLRSHPDQNLSDLGQRCLDNLFSGKFKLMEPNYFWTSGYEFFRMKEIDVNLYKTLEESKLIIFKGDLNHRKLLADMHWIPTTPFSTALQSFRPSNLCTVRTVKADLISGLKEGVAEELDQIDEDWMTTGQYGVIQFASRLD